MKRKITNYLNSKNPSEFNNLDLLLQCYLNGSLLKEIKKHDFSQIEIYFLIRKNSNNLQINLKYYNLNVCIDFDDINFDHAIYTAGVSAEELEKSFIKSSYENDFRIERIFSELLIKLENDCRLNMLSRINVAESRKLFKFLSLFSIAIPVLFGILLSIYVLVTGKSLYIGPWFLILIGVGVLLFVISGYYSNKK